jgi:hypothetical protein
VLPDRLSEVMGCVLSCRFLGLATSAVHLALLDFAANLKPQLMTTQPTAGRHDAVIRVYDEAGNVIETHEHAGEFKEWSHRSGWIPIPKCRMIRHDSRHAAF